MDYAVARQNMIDGQLTPNKVTDKELLQRMGQVPRELFVDTASRDVSYVDSPVTVGAGREMFPPLVCARLLQEMDLGEQDRMLVVAAGTGYSAAIASGLVKEVYAVEENMNLCDISRKALADSSCVNIKMLEGAPESGCSEHGPYDKILLDAPVEEIPQEIVNQVINGGLLGAVVKQADTGVLTATVYKKVGGTLFEEHLFETTGSVLDNFKAEERFVF